MQQWNRTAKLFHWTIALLFVVAAVVGTMAESLAMSPAKLQLFVTHKSLGITVLGLMLLRLLWRLLSTAPAPLDGLSANNQRFAALGHAGLYTLLIALPLSGWLLTSAANFPFRWFGWFKMPMLWPADKAVQDLAALAHWGLFLLVALLVVGHAGMAFWHARKGLPVLQRMFPLRPAPVWFLILLLLAAGVVAAVARVQSIQAPAAAAGTPGMNSMSEIQAEADAEKSAASSNENPEHFESHTLPAKQEISPQAETTAVDTLVPADPTHPRDITKAGAPAEAAQVATPGSVDSSVAAAVAAKAAIATPVAAKPAPVKPVVPEPIVPKPVAVAQPQAAASAAVPIQTATPPPSWIMQPANSSLGFTGSYTGAEFNGHFARFEPTIIFDPDKLDAARIEVVVDVTSATLGSADMDAMLPEPDWFYFSRYPQALFKATRFAKQGNGFVAQGELSLKGRSQPVTLVLDWRAQSATRARLQVDTTLNRVAFGIGSGEWAQDSSIGFEVRVHADLALQIRTAQ